MVGFGESVGWLTYRGPRGTIYIEETQYFQGFQRFPHKKRGVIL